MVQDTGLMEPSITPALVAVLGSIGVGLMGIAAAMFFRIFKSPRASKRPWNTDFWEAQASGYLF